MSNIGILAYGSLINDPGEEIIAKIVRRVRADTPFPIEYARLSRTRGGAPTLVPHSSGMPVKAKILVLTDSISIQEGKDLLYRREIRKDGSVLSYQEGSSKNQVLIHNLENFCSLENVLYTDFNPEGKISQPDPGELAKAAINSVSNARRNMDGISYLMNMINAGIETRLTQSYIEEILKQTGAPNLEVALQSLRKEL